MIIPPPALQELILREAACLDDLLYDDWLNLFDEECEYWIPRAHAQVDPRTHVSLFYEDRGLMTARVMRLRHPAAHSLAQPVRGVRIVGSFTMLSDNTLADVDIVIRSRFHLVESQGSVQRIFAGTYTHTIRPDTLKIRRKRVDLINCDGPFEVLQVYL
jgi:ethylbenzene dioxygenase beta subunit